MIVADSIVERLNSQACIERSFQYRLPLLVHTGTYQIHDNLSTYWLNFFVQETKSKPWVLSSLSQYTFIAIEKVGFRELSDSLVVELSSSR